MQPELISRQEQGVARGLLLWRLARPAMVASTASIGGGVGERMWILNLQVAHDYQRRDLDRHVAEIVADLDVGGNGVGLLTAAAVAGVVSEHDDALEVYATVGVRQPTWAASAVAPTSGDGHVGTINIVAFLPVRFAPGGLLNLLTTATEAKSQALWDARIGATGTASDAVCIVCPIDGPEVPFGGPRSLWGSRLARVVHRAVLEGVNRERA